MTAFYVVLISVLIVVLSWTSFLANNTTEPFFSSCLLTGYLLKINLIVRYSSGGHLRVGRGSFGYGEGLREAVAGGSVRWECVR